MGTVKSITVSPDLAKVLVTVETVREAEPLLTDKTIFWVVKPRAVRRQHHRPRDAAVRLLHRHAAVDREGHGQARSSSASRIRRSCRPGPRARPSSCDSKRLGSISLGSPIFFRDLEVGTVLGWDIGDLASSVTIHAFVRAPYDQYVHDDSSFWNASGLSVKLAATAASPSRWNRCAPCCWAASPSIRRPTPSSRSPRPTSSFPLYRQPRGWRSRRASASSSSCCRTSRARSPASTSGADVTLHGLKIGEVTDVDLVYDPQARSHRGAGALSRRGRSHQQYRGGPGHGRRERSPRR